MHFPTDINLSYDAMRKTITLTAQWCERRGRSDWRQYKYNIRHDKRLMRMAQNKKRSKARSPAQQEKNAALIVAAHEEYLTVAANYLGKARATLATLAQHARSTRPADAACLARPSPTMKRYSPFFEPHTEWISKGKAGVAVELGVKVCILEDQHQFILHHQVMEKQSDDQVTVSMVTEAKARFPHLNACSFDKGFHSQENQRVLPAHLELVALPRKG